jgi:hypothetical protein
LKLVAAGANIARAKEFRHRADRLDVTAGGAPESGTLTAG